MKAAILHLSDLSKIWGVAQYTKALGSLHSMSLSPKKNTTSTALEALKDAARVTGRWTPAGLSAKYGSQANLDSILADRFRFTLQLRIHKAWQNRQEIATLTYPLSCYKEVAPTKDMKGWLNVEPTTCSVTECCMAKELRDGSPTLEKMRNAILAKEKGTAEDQRKTKAAKEVLRGKTITEKVCRNLGDLIFAFFAPPDAVILTTNVRDHKLIAEAIGKNVQEP